MDKVTISTASNDYYAIEEKIKACDHAIWQLQCESYEVLWKGIDVQQKLDEIAKRSDAIKIERMGYVMQAELALKELHCSSDVTKFQESGIYSKSMFSTGDNNTHLSSVDQDHETEKASVR